jgi:hypothetical protein
MNHQKIYDAIIEKARKENRKKVKKLCIDYIYFENHHIIPRCLGGNDSKNNQILLTAKEHFVCHKLLTYIYKGNRKLVSALHRMIFSRRYGEIISGRDYEYVRTLLALLSNKNFYEYWIEKFGKEEADKKLKEFKNRNKDRNVGEKNPMFGKKQTPKSIERNKNSQPYNSTNFPQWLKDKLSEKSKGKNNAMFGKTFYEIWFMKYGKEIADKKLKEYKNNKKDKIWIKNSQTKQSKQIKKEDLEKYIGWEIGRFSQPNRKQVSEETKLKQSIKRKEYWLNKK